jgi:hypothetical protein
VTSLNHHRGKFGLAVYFSVFIFCFSATQTVARDNALLLTPEQKQALNNKEIRGVDHLSPPTWLTIPGGALIKNNPTGLADIQTYGRVNGTFITPANFASTMGTKDPSLAVRQEVIAAVSKAFSMREVAQIPTGERPIFTLPVLIIQMQPFIWGTEYFPLSWNKYRAAYATEIIIGIGGTNGWRKKFQCSTTGPSRAQDALSIQDTLKDNSAVLNVRLLEAARMCRDRTLAVFGLTGVDVPTDLVERHTRAITENLPPAPGTPQ